MKTKQNSLSLTFVVIAKIVKAYYIYIPIKNLLLHIH